MSLRFEAMTPTDDFGLYDTLVGAEMEPCDFLAGSELAEMLADGSGRAWWVWEGEQRVGWSCVMLPSPHHPDADAVHLLGSAVFRAFQGRGLGRAIAAWRADLYRDRPLTASVRPGNKPSERMLARNGFRQGLSQGPWRTWHRPRPLAIGQPGMVLVRSQAEPERTDHLIQALRAAGHFVSVDTGAPQEGGAILRGLWPDPAAFHHCIELYPLG
jgi:GNAT superfamily N-acetyltransferase